jgi:hypothetical protein
LEKHQPHHRSRLFWAAAGGVALLACLVFSRLASITVENQGAPPGFGWSWDFDYQTALGELDSTFTSPSDRPSGPHQDQLILILNQPQSIAGLEIIYRGLIETGRFRVDVIRPALEPGYAYPRELSESQARKGFALFDQRFVLTAVGPSALVLRPAARD